MKNKKGFFIIFFVFIFISFSFFREFIFKNINAHMWYLFYENDRSHLSPYLNFLNEFSYKKLYWFKWGLTIFFSLAFLGFSILIISLIFAEKKFLLFTIYFYFGILVISGLSYSAGWLLNEVEKGYTISRFFMGLVESPFILIFLIPAFKLAGSEEK